MIWNSGATSAAAAIPVLAGTYPGRKKLNTVGARSGLWPRPVAGSDVLPTAQAPLGEVALQARAQAANRSIGSRSLP